MLGSHIVCFAGRRPVIDSDTLIASGAAVIGDVVIEKDSSIWFNVSCRGDVHKIRIGSRTNIQDNSVIHVTDSLYSTSIGNSVTVGHHAIIHGCSIEDEVLIGMGAIILDGAVIPKHSIVAAGSLVPGNKTYPSGSLIIGSPAKVKRSLTGEEITKSIIHSAEHYVELSKRYK